MQKSTTVAPCSLAVRLFPRVARWSGAKGGTGARPGGLVLNGAGPVPMKPVELQPKAKGEMNYGHLAKWDVKIPTRSGWPGRGSSSCVPGCKPLENAERPGDTAGTCGGRKP